RFARLDPMLRAWRTALILPSFVLYRRRDIGYQAATPVTLPPHFTRRDRPLGRLFSCTCRRPQAARKGLMAMDHRIATTRPLGRVLTAGLTALALTLVVAPAAFGQAKPDPKKPAQPAKPAQQAQPQGAQPAQPQQAAEQPQLMYSPWMKVCG